MSHLFIYLGAVHSHDPNFRVVCGVRGCTRTYHNFYSFRKHIRRVHLEVEVEPAVADAQQMVTNMDMNGGVTHLEKPTSRDICGFELRNSALFLLKSKEVHKVSQLALDEMISEFAAMTSSELETLKAKVYASLQAAGINPDNVAGVPEAFKNSRLNDPYRGLSTQYQQRQYYIQNLNLVVSLLCTLVSLRNVLLPHKGPDVESLNILSHLRLLFNDA